MNIFCLILSFSFNHYMLCSVHKWSLWLFIALLFCSFDFKIDFNRTIECVRSCSARLYQMNNGINHRQCMQISCSQLDQNEILEFMNHTFYVFTKCFENIYKICVWSHLGSKLKFDINFTRSLRVNSIKQHIF